MRLLRGLLGVLLWLLASVLGLVGVLLCVTLILLPLGIPVLMLSRRLFSRAVRLMLPRPIAQPIEELKSLSRRRRKRAAGAVDAGADTAKGYVRRSVRKASDKASKVDLGKKPARRARRRLGLG